jgi:outer membrane protein with beta-barrel domain
MMRSGITVVALIGLVALGSAAQVEEHFNFSGGAGFSIPTDGAGKNLNTGWNFDLRGGYNLAPHLSADVDFGYNYWNLNSAALARFGEPGGYNSIWALSFNPVYRFAPKSKADFYTTGGFGLYHRNLPLTRPATENVLVCDPFFGFCFPAVVGVTEVVASSSTYKGGFNLGEGVEFRLGGRRTKIFSEARYQCMFTTHGTDLTYVPVTFGFRW